MRFFQKVRATERIPPGYGVVRRYFDRDVALMCPIPFSTIFRIALTAWYHVHYWLRIPVFWTAQERANNEAYRDGYNRGFERGREEGYDAGVRHTTAAVRATARAIEGKP